MSRELKQTAYFATFVAIGALLYYGITGIIYDCDYYINKYINAPTVAEEAKWEVKGKECLDKRRATR